MNIFSRRSLASVGAAFAMAASSAPSAAFAFDDGGRFTPAHETEMYPGRPGFPGRPGRPGFPGRPGPRGWQCVAVNGRGMQFIGRGWNRQDADWQAMRACQSRSRFCRSQGCQPL